MERDTERERKNRVIGSRKAGEDGEGIVVVLKKSTFPSLLFITSPVRAL